MQERVLQNIVEHKLIASGTRVLVGLSGGPDSVALLHVLFTLADELGFDLAAAHLDHGMRAESRQDAYWVENLCRQWSVPLFQRRIVVPDHHLPGEGGLEQVARRLRRNFLEETAEEHDCHRIALGHHCDDQAETILHRLLRGSGPLGLSAMRSLSGKYIRPLLAINRQDILAYLRARNIPWREDLSNRDPRFTRNRIRQELLPVCRSFNPRFEDALCRLARRLSLEEDYWQSVVAETATGWSVARGRAKVSQGQICCLHPALRDRILRFMVAQVRGSLRGIEDKHISALVALVQTADQGQKEVHLPSLWAAVRYGELVMLDAPPPPPDSYFINIAGPGNYMLPEGGTVSFELVPEVREAPGVFCAEFDAARISFPLVLRSWLPGDRMVPEGMRGHRKLKDIFIDSKLPRESRSRIPVLVHQGEILWVVGLRRCRGYGPRKSSERVLRVTLIV